MRLCIFGAASKEIERKYIDIVERFGSELANAGHELVFGAGANGLMGAAARGFKAVGGKITGVIPNFFKDETIEAIYDGCDEIIFTETMRERKQTMEDLSDAFVVVPGGIGTLEEFFEVLTLKQLGRHKKPIAIYDIDGYYSNLTAFMERCSNEGFIGENCKELYMCSDDSEKLIEYITNAQPITYSVKELKNG